VLCHKQVLWDPILMTRRSLTPRLFNVSYSPSDWTRLNDNASTTTALQTISTIVMARAVGKSCTWYFTAPSCLRPALNHVTSLGQNISRIFGSFITQVNSISYHPRNQALANTMSLQRIPTARTNPIRLYDNTSTTTAPQRIFTIVIVCAV
jgi:hypothetical protein